MQQRERKWLSVAQNPPDFGGMNIDICFERLVTSPVQATPVSSGRHARNVADSITLLALAGWFETADAAGLRVSFRPDTAKLAR
jgi:hypothetical protein